MPEFTRVLLEAWQEACRHIEITEAAANIAVILARQAPVDRVIVRRFDPEHQYIETVAAVSLESNATPFPIHSTISPERWEAALDWAAEGHILHEKIVDSSPPEALQRPDGESDDKASPLSQELYRRTLLLDMLPGGISGDVVAGRLGSATDPGGVLILVARKGARFSLRDRELLEALLEPFTVAMENDHRLHEMEALRAAAEEDNRSLLKRLGRNQIGDTIVGSDTGLHAVMERVELVSRSDVPVLVFGETGTGKELVARAIHARSSRSHGPILRVNCGAIPADLVDSQLFGHERGAFTGAEKTHQGWFERADGGTLFLDEIGELSLAAQVRLLRIVQDGRLERVGGKQWKSVDVRIIAATHRDLAAMVAEGQFREDLWYRLAVFPLVLPPLRERQEDIPAMVGHFARRAAIRFSLAPCEPTEDDLRQLKKYAWPGNVRELGAVIDRAAILGDGQRLDVAKALGFQSIEADQLAAARTGSAPSSLSGEPSSITQYPGQPQATLTSLDEVIRLHIERALRQTSGRVEGPRGAAALLEMNPNTLRSRMRKLKINWRDFRN